MDWHLFLSTFSLIFIAELPDKTAFATLLLASRHGAVPVFAGAAGAFVIHSLIAIAFGSAISLLPAKVVHLLAAVLFLIFAVMLWREKSEHGDDAVTKEGKKWKSTFRARAGSAFMVIFVAEWGDLTQLATATLEAKFKAPLTIFFAATLALWSVAALGAAVGHHARKRLNPKILQKMAAFAFAVVGVVFLARR